jgi:hypothetical protein
MNRMRLKETNLRQDEDRSEAAIEIGKALQVNPALEEFVKFD